MPYKSPVSKARYGGERSRLVKVRARKAVTEAKAARGNKCQDCGGVFHPIVLEFAHVDEHRHKKDARLKRAGGKMGMVGLARRSMEAFVREISMCRLLCANCHRLESIKGEHWLLEPGDLEDDPQGSLF
jgi:5-methylcytosine-specific restriction endonuclease McrA